MPTDLSSIDLATLSAAQGVIVAAIRQRCCQWEQDSADAVADGRLRFRCARSFGGILGHGDGEHLHEHDSIGSAAVLG